MASRLVRRTKMFGEQLRRGDWNGMTADVRRWMWSEATGCGLQFSKGDVATPPPAKVDLHARPLDADIASAVFDLADLSNIDEVYIANRRAIYEAGFAGGWVAVTDDGEPAYLQWLIPPSERAKIVDFFGGLFPDRHDTLIVEGAWIPPAFRKQKVMGQGLALVTQAALDASADTIKHALCFPDADNKGAVLGTISAGYTVTEKRIDTWRFGRQTSTFTPATQADFAILNDQAQPS